MRFLVDAQLPPGLARWLSQRGHDARHVIDVGLASASDTEIWHHAKAHDAVILTKDEDFAATRRDTESPAVVWVRVGNSTNAELIRVFGSVLPGVERALAEGEKLVEIR